MKVVQHNILYRRPRWGSSSGLTQQHTYRLHKAHFQHFETHLSQKKTAMEKFQWLFSSIDVKLIMFLPKLFFMGRSSCYTQWGMYSGKTRESPQVYSVTKMWNQLGNEAMCKDTSCNKYNDQTNLRHTNFIQSLYF